MPVLIAYLLKLSLSLALVWLFYQLLLRKLTFYNSNRWYLLGYSLLSFFIPFINITPVLERNELAENKMLHFIPSVQTYASHMEELTACPAPVGFANWNKWDWILLAVVCGAVFLFLKLLVRYYSFRRIRRSAQLISDGEMKIYQVNRKIIPFSFGNAIFINQSLHTETELAEIIRHEFVHVKQRHTLDILWAEWLCLLNWYNPFAWLIRNSIRQNLEFIADHQVVQSGIDKRQYQYLLLKVIGNNHFSIANQFNFSSLKKRIAMMNKIKTTRVHLLRFLFLLPLLAALLLSFRKELVNDKAVSTGWMTHDQQPADTVPLTKVPEVVSLHRDDAMDDGHRQFFEKNRNVLLLHWKNHAAELEVYLEGERVETYHLTDTEDLKKAEAKYGPLPEPVPGSVDSMRNGSMTMAEREFIRRHPAVKGIFWAYNKVPAIVNKQNESMQTNPGKTGDVLMNILFKNGQWDMYNISRPEEVERFNKKYGEKPPIVPMPAAAANARLEPAPNDNGYFISIADNKGNCMVVVKNKSQEEIERVLLTEWQENQFYEEKYGQIPAISKAGLPAGDLPSAVEKTKRDMIFVADTIYWASQTGMLQLVGNASLQTPSDVVISSDSIELHQNISLLYIDGKEANPRESYIGKKGGKYQVKNLSIEEAVQKYGEKGRGGAMEISSL